MRFNMLGWLKKKEPVQMSAAGTYPLPDSQQFTINSLLATIQGTSSLFSGSFIQDRSKTLLSRDDALTVATIFRCVSIISSTIASLPVEIVKTPELNPTPPTDDYSKSIYDLINSRPDGVRTIGELMEVITADLVLDGVSYLAIHKKFMGVHQLSLATDPRTVKILKRNNNSLMYGITTDTGIYDIYPASHIIRITASPIASRHFGAEGLDRKFSGISIHSAIKQAVRASMNAEDYINHFFSQGVGADIAIESDHQMTADQKEAIRYAIEKRNTGNATSRKPLILSHGLQAKNISNSAQRTETSTLRHDQNKEIAMAYGVPYGILYPESRTDNTENLYRLFYRSCLKRYISRIEDEFSLTLWPEKEYRIRFNTNSLLRGDVAALTSLAQVALGGSQTKPFMTVNEVRKLFGLPDMPDSDDLPDNAISQSPPMPPGNESDDDDDEEEEDEDLTDDDEKDRV